MRKLSQSPGVALSISLIAQLVGAQDSAILVRIPDARYPEPHPPVLESVQDPRPSTPARHAVGIEPYTIGDPTDEEQHYVELVNRARANPQAEIERLLTTTDRDVQSALNQYNVDLALARSQFAGIRPAPPVSIHPLLTAAARVHCNDMFQNEFQGHVGTDGSSVGTRVTRTGYRWNSVAENVFSYAESVLHGHAGFEIDWGEGEGGMQTPPGHRNTIHNKAFREIGVGVILGTKGKVGPQLVVQEFAYHNALTPFITGVVYYDLNANQAYDPGEGIGGVTVSVGGSAQTGLSARSGGYSVPVVGNGTYSVTFDVPGMTSVTRLANVVDNENVKLDLVPSYSPPVISGPSVASKDRNNTYTFTPVGGATSYEWRSMKRMPWTTVETATAGLGRFEAAVSASYPPVTNGVNGASGPCFHLAHPAPPGNQYLTLQPVLRIGSGSELTFRSRLGSSAADQTARVQISEDGGSTWSDLWTQTGNGAPGETTFSGKSIGLGMYVGKAVRFRFAYTFTSGSYFPQTSLTAGWFFDDVNISAAEELSDESIQATTSAPSFAFRPTTLDAYQIQVRPVLGERRMAWGPGFLVSVQEAGPEPATVSVDRLTATTGGWELGFTVIAGVAGTFQIEAAPEIVGPWSTVNGASVTAQGGGAGYRAAWPHATGVERQFYRVVSQ